MPKKVSIDFNAKEKACTFKAKAIGSAAKVIKFGLETARGQGLTSRCLEAKAWPGGVSRSRPGLEVSRGQGLALRCLEAKAWP